MKTIHELIVQDKNFVEKHQDVSQDCKFSTIDDDASATRLGALPVLKSALKQHPWSVSDPGPPTSPRIQHPPPEYLSLPLVEKHPIFRGEFQVEQQLNRDGGPGEINKAIIKTLWSNTQRNKEILKWLFILLNVLLELCQAVLTQEKNEKKMGRKTYLNVSIITSSICLIMAGVEVLHEGRRLGVVWQKRGNCCCFYYPGNQGRVFCRISLYFALISSFIQLIINLTAKLTKTNSVQFDYVPLLLAVCYLVAAVIGSRETTTAISIRCNVHGFINAEGIFLEGLERRVFHCPQCEMEGEAYHSGH